MGSLTSGEVAWGLAQTLKIRTTSNELPSGNFTLIRLELNFKCSLHH